MHTYKYLNIYILKVTLTLALTASVLFCLLSSVLDLTSLTNIKIAQH